MNIKYLKILWLIIFASGLILFCYYRYTGFLSDDIVINYITKYNDFAPFVYLVIFTIFTIFVFPTFPLTISAGLIWGPYMGIVYASLGYLFGTTLGFIISRYFAYDYVKNKINIRSFDWIMTQVDKRGWRIVALARLTSLFPVGFFNYIFGISNVKFIEYAIASNLSIFPTTIAYVVFGYSISETLFSENNNILLIGLIIFAVIVISLMIIRKYFKIDLHKNK